MLDSITANLKEQKVFFQHRFLGEESVPSLFYASAVNSPLWFYTHNKTSGHTAAPGSRELTRVSIQGFLEHWGGLKISEKREALTFTTCIFGRGFSGNTAVYFKRTRAFSFTRSWGHS